MRRFRDYDPFAWVYTRYWGDVFHAQALPALDRAALSELKPRAAILDLCCGDGRISAALARRGFRVTGVDGSEQMLVYARRRSPQTAFLLADARDFQLPPRFDAAISTFDSLNHIMNTADLRKVFANVRGCLKRGAPFVFDLNREQAYTSLWSRSSHTIDVDCVSIARGSYEPRQRLARCDITLLRFANGQWLRSDFQMKQRFHPQRAVLAALRAAGFEACVRDAAELGMKGEIGVGRDFYIARASESISDPPARRSRSAQAAFRRS